MTNHNGTLASNIFSPTKTNHINMSELQWHSCRRKILPKGQNHRKHCAQWCISLTFIYFLMSVDDKSQWHTGFKHLQPNESKSHQYVRITMAQLQKEDTSKRAKSQKTLRTMVHRSNFSLLFNVCRWQITRAHWFQTSSAQRKQITSICQNYNGTATTTRYFQKTKITENIAHSGASVCFFFIFDVWLWRVSIIFSPMKANHTWCQNY